MIRAIIILLLLAASIHPTLAGTYQLINGSTAIMRTSDGASIPADPNNTDYAAYLAWKAAGNTPSAASAPSAAAAAQSAYNAAITGGLAVTSTGTPSINGTYSIGPANTADIQAEVQFIQQFGTFTTGNTTTLPWADQTGAIHTFTGTAQFLAFAKGAAMYVAACKVAQLTQAAGGTATWPSNAATIP